MINLKFLNVLTKNICSKKGNIYHNSIFIDWKNISCWENCKLVNIKLKEVKENLNLSIHKDDILELKNDFEFYNWWQNKILFKNDISEIKINCWNLKLPPVEEFKKNDGLATTYLDIKELQKILKVYDEAGINYINLTIWKKLQPILIKSSSDSTYTNIEEIEAILMPINKN